jgi:hypothetical protein
VIQEKEKQLAEKDKRNEASLIKFHSDLQQLSDEKDKENTQLKEVVARTYKDMSGGQQALQL